MSDEAARLRPMTSEEFDAWLPRQVAEYAEMIAASGAMPPEAAQAKAVADTVRVLPRGLASPGQLLFRVMAAGTAVGSLWLGVPGPDPDPRMAWVYDIQIDAAYRGHGYGRLAMRLAEDEVRSRGMTSLGLNVHGQNTVARTLYDSLGYEVMAQQMKKSVSG